VVPVPSDRVDVGVGVGDVVADSVGFEVFVGVDVGVLVGFDVAVGVSVGVAVAVGSSVTELRVVRSLGVNCSSLAMYSNIFFAWSAIGATLPW
jgi:hypothetical protein